MPQPTQQTPSSPLPNLSVQVGSGLNFPWSEYHRGVAGTAEAILGADGVTQGMVIWMNWRDIVAPSGGPPYPLGQLLGYSRRILSPVPNPPAYILSRYLPWQSPYLNQLFVKRISSVRGVQQGGKVVNFSFGSYGTSPAIDFKLGLVALEFWRPPYFVLPDSQVPRDNNLYPQEWVRYLDKRWEMSTQMLSRQGQMFVWVDPTDAGGSQFGVPGAPGQPLIKLHLKRRWYEIPEQAVFSKLPDGTPNGIPKALVYTQSQVINPISCFMGPLVGGVYNYPNMGLPTSIGATYLAGSPIIGTVNAPTAASGSSTPQEIFDSDGTYNPGSGIIPYNRFLGFPMGTLLYLGAEIIPRPLQMPAWMMEVPFINATEPASQQQYDIVLNFLYFDPPVNAVRASGGPVEPFRGHNLMPFSGTGLFKAVRTQRDLTGSTGSTVGPFTTPLWFSNFTDLFKVVQDS